MLSETFLIKETNAIKHMHPEDSTCLVYNLAAIKVLLGSIKWEHWSKMG